MEEKRKNRSAERSQNGAQGNIAANPQACAEYPDRGQGGEGHGVSQYANTGGDSLAALEF